MLRASNRATPFCITDLMQVSPMRPLRLQRVLPLALQVLFFALLGCITSPI